VSRVETTIASATNTIQHAAEIAIADDGGSAFAPPDRITGPTPERRMDAGS
jgi:hypothetical protein